jgi:hypothetical protein
VVVAGRCFLQGDCGTADRVLTSLFRSRHITFPSDENKKPQAIPEDIDHAALTIAVYRVTVG